MIQSGTNNQRVREDRVSKEARLEMSMDIKAGGPSPNHRHGGAFLQSQLCACQRRCMELMAYVCRDLQYVLASRGLMV